jgi:hypothetical protein
MHSQPEEKMAVADFAGCAQGKIQQLFAEFCPARSISGKREFSGKV